MAFWDTFYGWLGGNADRHGRGAQSSQPASTIHDDAPYVGVDGAMQISTVWACVTLIAENVASLPLIPYIRDSEGRRQLSPDEPLYRILHDKPNARHTSIVFWQIMLFNFILRGNAYARKETFKNGEVMALWPLSSSQMEVNVDDNGNLLYRYRQGIVTTTYKADQILHIRGIGNDVMGLGVLDYMRASVSLSIKAQNHLNRTFSKQARRPGVMMVDRVLNEAQRTAVRKNFNDITNGCGNELHLLEANMKFEALGMSPADIQLLETRKFSVQDLARWFGVPSVLINDTGETTSLGSSVQQIVDGFYKLKLRPMLELLEQSLQEQILTPEQRARRIFTEFSLDALLRASLKERMEVYSQGAQNGLYKRNECRGWENLPPVDGGDILTAQSNLVPLTQLGQSVNTGGSVPPAPIQQ